MKNVTKRTGKIEQLSKKKIFDSICNANAAVEDKSAQLTRKQIIRITETVYEYCENLEDTIEIDTLEDIIEKKLMEAQGYETAKRYITYRYEKERIRTNKSLTEKLTAANVQNQNANIDEFSFGGRVGEAAGYVMKNYALEHLISKKHVQNHVNNEIYIHDLDAYAVGSHNCLSIPFDKLLKEGFNTRQTDVRPAGSINTAFQLVAVIFQLQSLQQFGGVSATHLDWTMIPYVRLSFWKHYKELMTAAVNFDVDYFIKNGALDDTLKGLQDKSINPKDVSIESESYIKYSKIYSLAYDATVKELEQAVEGMYHNLNTLQSRSGNQLPFTSINYGTCTLPEGRMVTKALIEGSIKGCGKFHKTSIFPCGIFQCMKGVNRKEGDPNYDLFKLALKSTSLRLYPNYANVDWSVNAGYDKNDPEQYVSTMGCRTYNGFDINGMGFKKDGRGNISPVTIILPTLAMQAKEKVDNEIDKRAKKGELLDIDYSKSCVSEFMKLLDKKINEARDMLLERFDWQCSQPAKSAKFMYENGTMAGYVPEEGIRSALKHGTLVIGQLGLAETLQILIGCDHTDEKNGMPLAIEIETLFNQKCAKFKKDLKLNFGVYYTPAENLCYTAMKKFKEKYGEIKNVSDHEFFTNSMHVPVWKKMTPFEKIDIESKLTGLSNGGCITYVELDSGTVNNIAALEELVNYAMDKDIPYFAVNVPSDSCNDCGYQGTINDKCPQCGSTNIQQLRRVTGYLTGNYKTAFNAGKQDEVEHRVKHNGIEC